MFKAFLLICRLSDPNVCLIVEDTQSIYPTHKQCKARLEDLKNKVTQVIPDSFVAKKTCLELYSKKERL